MVPCGHLLANSQVLEVTLLEPHVADFMIPSLSHHLEPFAQKPCLSLPHRAAGCSLSPYSYFKALLLHPAVPGDSGLLVPGPTLQPAGLEGGQKLQCDLKPYPKEAAWAKIRI